jgi:hypothetical protein
MFKLSQSMEVYKLCRCRCTTLGQVNQHMCTSVHVVGFPGSVQVAAGGVSNLRADQLGHVEGQCEH